jgi:hypothetical protein
MVKPRRLGVRAQTAMTQALGTFRIATRGYSVFRGHSVAGSEPTTEPLIPYEPLPSFQNRTKKLFRIQNKQGPPGREAVNLAAGFTSTHIILSTQVETILKCLPRPAC